MYSPRNRTSWDLYMLKDRSKDKFYGRSHLVRLRGKYTVQTAHCALIMRNIVHDLSGTPQLYTIPNSRDIKYANQNIKYANQNNKCANAIPIKNKPARSSSMPSNTPSTPSQLKEYAKQNTKIPSLFFREVVFVANSRTFLAYNFQRPQNALAYKKGQI